MITLKESKKRKRKPKTEEQNALHAFRKYSPDHVLVLEADCPEEEKRWLFHEAELLRKAGNELTGIMKKNCDQLIRTKRYRRLKQLYGKAVDSKNDALKKDIVSQMKSMQEEFSVTPGFCCSAMSVIKDRYSLPSVSALSRAENIWSGVKKCLYSDGKALHFKRYGDLPSIGAKQINKGTILNVINDELVFRHTYKGHSIMLKTHPKDRFQRDEVDAILKYLEQPELNDRNAVEVLKAKGRYVDTYRPCYASIVCQSIRGRLRVFVHITVEGRAMPKYDRNGCPRHNYGRGNIGNDIGTQTVAYTSDKEVGLLNLAERSQSALENERQQRLLYRAMDRSRRATNPDNYNEDGTIVKGQKIWHYSNRYKKLRKKHRELCRINAVNRHLAINELVNHIRELGDTFITEPKNSKKLQKRAKKTTVNEKTGKINKKKRFGGSIGRRCPGYFQAAAQRKFESTGGRYIEVTNDYRASQYDHTSDSYIKKKLHDRMYDLQDGTPVQRDWYSSFLLYCIDMGSGNIDKEKCKSLFNGMYEKEKELIKWIQDNKIKVMNSGIKV